MTSISPNVDDLIVLLTVARLGKFSAAANVLNTSHTTVSRRIAALNKALGSNTLVRGEDGWELTPLGYEAITIAEQVEDAMKSLSSVADRSGGLSGVVRISAPEAFSMEFATPAAVRVQKQHPKLNVELLSSTRRVYQHRSGVDIEVIVGGSAVRNTVYIPLTTYELRLYASTEYLNRHGTPESLESLGHHTLISYIESDLQVSELGRKGTGLPEPKAYFQSNGIFSQLMAARHHAGIALLPSFLVDQEHGLVPVLEEDLSLERQFGAVIHVDSVGSDQTKIMLQALKHEVQARKQQLIWSSKRSLTS